MLINPSRNMVVIQGGCDGEALMSLVILSHQKIEGLQRMGIETLETFVDRTGLKQKLMSQ